LTLTIVKFLLYITQAYYKPSNLFLKVLFSTITNNAHEMKAISLKTFLWYNLLSEGDVYGE
ncbi:MAG TPA: hypothetical protein DHV77_05995, partial [Erysipelotrichaceae bacterium]|nr:hypothetical protein [Erysipelotrichaceae bacterium]